MVSATKEKKTYKDYQKLPEGSPYQLIDGMFVKSPSPSVNHQRVLKRLFSELIKIEESGVGEVLTAPIDVHLSETETYQPDLIFIKKEHLSIIKDKRIEGAPDLVIEILSPSSAYYDLRHKKAMYGRAGVQEYWIVDPMEKAIELFLNEKVGFSLKTQIKDKGSVGSKVLPSFNVKLEYLFKREDYGV